MKKFLTAMAAAAGLATALVGSAGALENPRQVYNGFNLNEMQQVGTEMGLTHEFIQTQDGGGYLKYVTPEGYQFYVAPAVCDNTTCYGLDIYTFFGSDSGVPLSALNFFNQYRAFTKAFSQDGQILLTRYIIADFGIPKGNIASNLSNFVAVAVDFDQYLRQGKGQAFSVDGMDETILSFGMSDVGAVEKLETDLSVQRIMKRGVQKPFNDK